MLFDFIPSKRTDPEIDVVPVLEMPGPLVQLE